MSRVKVDFKKPVPVQIQKSRDIQDKMKNNTNFTTPDPALSDVEKATDDLEEAYKKGLNNDKEMKALMRVTRKTLEALISKLADYVQIASGGDQTIILSSGFEVRKTPTPVNIPLAPIALKVKAATHNGILELVWKSSKTAKSYIVQSAIDPFETNGFEQAGICTKASFKVSGLQPGTKYWFQVSAINAAGNSGWSEPASGRTL